MDERERGRERVGWGGDKGVVVGVGKQELLLS